MTKIKQPKPNYKTLGARLKAARLKQDLSRASLAHKLHLKVTDITDIENGLPSAWEGVYKRGYVTAYASIVGEKIDLNNDPTGTTVISPLAKPLNQHSLIVSQILTIAAVVLIVTGIIGYVGLQVFTLISPPALKVYTPLDGLVTHASSVEVYGKTTENTDVAINGVSILVEPDGIFRTEVPLKQGFNALTITATNRLTKQSTITKTIVTDYQIDPI